MNFPKHIINHTEGFSLQGIPLSSAKALGRLGRGGKNESARGTMGKRKERKLPPFLSSHRPPRAYSFFIITIYQESLRRRKEASIKDDAHKRARPIIQNYFKCFKYKHLSGAWYRIQLYQLLRLSMKINVIFALKRVYTCAYFKSTMYGLRGVSLYST